LSCSKNKPAWKLVQIETLLETIYTSACINQLLFTSEERVALRADFDLDVLLGGHSFHYITAVASDGGLFKIRMNAFSHGVSPPVSVVCINSSPSTIAPTVVL
jgi:hypothetical protein